LCRHRQASKFARQAIKKLNVTVNDEQILINNSIVATDSIAATTVIAYFNAAVEYEYLGEWDFAKQAYEMALKVCRHSNHTIQTQN
jgi:hypothetical protein